MKIGEENYRSEILRC